MVAYGKYVDLFKLPTISLIVSLNKKETKFIMASKLKIFLSTFF